MSYVWKKILAQEGSSSYTPTGLNKMSFQIEHQNELIDLNKSYCLFDVTLTQSNISASGSTLSNVAQPWIFGNQGVKYDSSALVRNILLQSDKGMLENIVTQNVLSQSLNVNYLMSKSEQKSLDIFNIYSGEEGSDGQGYTNSSPWINYISPNQASNAGIISTGTPGVKASVILPLKNTMLGLAKTGPVNFGELGHEGPLLLRMELEDQLNILTQGYASTFDLSVFVPNTGNTNQYIINNVICEPTTYSATYSATTATSNLVINLPFTYGTTLYPAYPIAGTPTGLSNTNPGFLSVSYVSPVSGRAITNEICEYTAANLTGNSLTLTLTTELKEAGPIRATAADTGVTSVAVRFAQCGIVAGTGTTTAPKTITIVVPTSSANQCNSPYTINQTITVWGPNLQPDNPGPYSYTYQITNITNVAGAGFNTFTITVDRDIGTPKTGNNYTVGNYMVYFAATPETAYSATTTAATAATWAISNPQLSLACVMESHEMRAKRHEKRDRLNIKKHEFFTWIVEQYTNPADFSVFSRQWYVLPETYLAVLCTPVNGSLLSVTDNIAQIRLIKNGEQITNRPILLEGLLSPGSQFYQWVKSVLLNYGDMQIKQLQQIPPDKTGTNIIIPMPIQDLRFEQDEINQHHVLDFQLYAGNGLTSSAKMMYLFKLVLKTL